MKRIAALDPGEARVGVAISDDERRMAFPRPNVDGRGKPEAVAQRIKDVLASEDVETIIIGLPLTLEGREGMAARKARAFAKVIERVVGLPVLLRDERLTTSQATRSLATLGVKGASRRQAVDSAAAAILLQAYLEACTE
jgi:putative Holliday junction resolvase